jgi:serine/threonine-protein kinase
VLGSPLYMSPEQMRSARGVDERTDIWSLGVILYELVTGLVPFDAPTMPQLCAAILERPPRSMRALCADVPEELDALVLRCLDKNPAGRPASIAALSADLAPFAPRGARLHVERIARMLSAPAPSDLGETEPDGASAAGGSDASGLVAARSPGMRAARAGVFGGAVGALLVLGALATWHAVSRRTPAEPAPSALALPTSLVVTSASVPGAVSELGMATASAAPASADAGASGGIAGRADARPPTGAHPSGSSVVSGPAPGARASSSSGAAAKRPDDEAFTDRK